MRSGWQTHKGQQFFFGDYANLNGDSLREEVDAGDVLIVQQPVASVVALIDVNGVTPTRENLGIFIKSVQRTTKYVRKSAVIGVGLSGQRKVLFDAVKRITEDNMMVFDDVEAAKDWLLED